MNDMEKYVEFDGVKISEEALAKKGYVKRVPQPGDVLAEIPFLRIVQGETEDKVELHARTPFTDDWHKLNGGHCAVGLIDLEISLLQRLRAELNE